MARSRPTHECSLSAQCGLSNPQRLSVSQTSAQAPRASDEQTGMDGHKGAIALSTTVLY